MPTDPIGARFRIKTQSPTDQRIIDILKANDEALVITLNHSGDGVDLTVHTKLMDNESVLTAYLDQVIINISRIKNGQQPHCAGQATPIGA